MRTPVVDRPILGFLVGPRHDSTGALRERFPQGSDAIADAGHDEVEDTAVLDAIFEALFVPLARRGFNAEAVLSA